MDWMEFVSEIISSISWPIVLLIILVVFKKNLGNTLDNIKAFKYKSLRLEFERLNENASHLKTNNEIKVNNLILNSIDEQITNSLDVAPLASIVLAWAGIESAIQSVIIRNNIIPPENKQRSLPHCITVLYKKGIISEEYFRVINDMRRIRNSVAHSDPKKIFIQTGQATDYAINARKIINYLENR